MNTRIKYLIPLALIGYCLVATAAEDVKEATDKLQSINKQASDQGTQLVTQQRALQDEIVNLANQRREIEEREKVLARTMRDHAKRLEDQKHTLEALELQLSEQKRAYEEQRRRFEELRDQLTGVPSGSSQQLSGSPR